MGLIGRGDGLTWSLTVYRCQECSRPSLFESDRCCSGFVDEVEVVPASQLRGAVQALEQARGLVAEAYSDDEHDDSPGNMAYAVLNAALNRFGGQ